MKMNIIVTPQYNDKILYLKIDIVGKSNFSEKSYIIPSDENVDKIFKKEFKENLLKHFTPISIIIDEDNLRKLIKN